MLLEAATTLRVLAGVVGVGYSLYSKSQDEKFDFGQVSEAIFGQAVGGIFYDWFKSGSKIAYQRFLSNLNTLDKDSLNYDLQRAASKAQILATFFACQACLINLKTDRSSVLDKVKHVAGQDKDFRWLTEVSKYLKASIKNPPDHIFDARLDYQDIFSIFDQQNLAGAESTQQEVSEKIKKAVIADIKNTYFGVDSSAGALSLLEGKINDGWEESPNASGSIIQLKIENRRKNKYDWFELVCILFNEEYKENPRVKAAMEAQAHLSQIALLNSISKNLNAFGTLGVGLNELINQVTDFREENFYLHKITHQELKEIKETLAELKKERERDAIAREKENREKSGAATTEVGTVLGDFNYKRPTKFFNRESDFDKLKRFVLNHPQPIIVIKGAGGFGKTSLAEHLLKEIAPRDKIADTNIVNEIAIFDGQKKGDLTFENIFFRSAELLDRVFKAEGEKSLLRGVFKIEEMDDEQRIRFLFVQLKRLGKVWFFFDNCESVLTEANVLKDERLTKLLELALNYKDNLRVILTTREVPIFEGSGRVSLLVMDGHLPPADAVDYLKQLAVDFNTNWRCSNERETEDLLAVLAEKLRYIPKALFSFADYYSQERENPLVLRKVLEREELFADFAKFDLEKGYAKLIGEQLEILSPLERAVWQVLSVFREPVSVEAIKFVLSDYDLTDVWQLLRGSGSIIAEEREIEGNYFRLFSLEQSVKDYIYQLLPAEVADSDSQSQFFNRRQLNIRAAEFYRSIHKPVEDCHKPEDFSSYFNEMEQHYQAGQYESVVLAATPLMFKITELGLAQEIIERLNLVQDKLTDEKSKASNFNNLGMALHSLFKFKEAVVEYNKAIGILEELADDDKRLGQTDDLATTQAVWWTLPGALTSSDSTDNLIIVYFNKWYALESLLERKEAIVESDKAIAILEKLVNEQGRSDLLYALALAYKFKSDSLHNSGKLYEAQTVALKGNEIFEGLVNEQGRLMPMELMAAYAYIGLFPLLHQSFWDSKKTKTKNKERAKYYDKRIEILEELVNEQGHAEFANQLAMSYVSKGIMLRNSGSDEGFELDTKAIELLEGSLQRGDLHSLPLLARAIKQRSINYLWAFKRQLARKDSEQLQSLLDYTRNTLGLEHFAGQIALEITYLQDERTRLKKTFFFRLFILLFILGGAVYFLWPVVRKMFF
ncbi:MAG TPA: hypothetical protein VN256_03815 [Pyrinomonadaceae bacterium]|nr:hypothetical protein [Pyrinomonadaceae bacterium]